MIEDQSARWRMSPPADPNRDFPGCSPSLNRPVFAEDPSRSHSPAWSTGAYTVNGGGLGGVRKLNGADSGSGASNSNRYHPDVGRRAVRTVIGEKSYMERATGMVQNYVPIHTVKNSILGNLRTLGSFASASLATVTNGESTSKQAPSNSSQQPHANGFASCFAQNDATGAAAADGNGFSGFGAEVLWVKHQKVTCAQRVNKSHSVVAVSYVIIGTATGLQIWDMTNPDSVCLVGARDVVCTLATILPDPEPAREKGSTCGVSSGSSQVGVDIYANDRPLIGFVPLVDGPSQAGVTGNSEGVYAPSRLVSHGITSGSVSFGPVRTTETLHGLQYADAITCLLASSRHVLVATTDTIHGYHAADLSVAFRLEGYRPRLEPAWDGSNPRPQQTAQPLALGTRWLAYGAVGERAVAATNGSSRRSSLSVREGGGVLVGAASVGERAGGALDVARGFASGLWTLGDKGMQTVSGYLAGGPAPPAWVPPSSAPSSKSPSPTDTLGLSGASPGQRVMTPAAESSTDLRGPGSVVVIYDIDVGTPLARITPHGGAWVGALAFDPTGSLLLTASVSGRDFQVFRLSAKPPPEDLHVTGGVYGSVGTIPVGSLGSSVGSVASTATAHSVRSVAPQTVASVGPPQVAGGPRGGISVRHMYRLSRGLTNAHVGFMEFSPDSRWVAVGTTHGTVHIFAIHPMGGLVSYRTHCTPTPPNLRVFASAGAESLPAVQQAAMGAETLTTVARVRQAVAQNPPTLNRKPAAGKPQIGSPSLQTPPQEPAPVMIAGSPVSAVFGGYGGYQERADGEKTPLHFQMFVTGQDGKCTEYRLTPRRAAQDSADNTLHPSERDRLVVECTGQGQWDFVRAMGDNSDPTQNRPPSQALKGKNPTHETPPHYPKNPVKEILATTSAQNQNQDLWLSQVEISTHVDFPPLWVGAQFTFRTFADQFLAPSAANHDPQTEFLSGQRLKLATNDLIFDDHVMPTQVVGAGRSDPVAVPRGVGWSERWNGMGDHLITPPGPQLQSDFLDELTSALDSQIDGGGEFGRRERSGGLSDRGVHDGMLISGFEEDGFGRAGLADSLFQAQSDMGMDVMFFADDDGLPQLPRSRNSAKGDPMLSANHGGASGGGGGGGDGKARKKGGSVGASTANSEIGNGYVDEEDMEDSLFAVAYPRRPDNAFRQANL